MRAAVLREYGEPLRIERRERPEPGHGEAIVEVEACGVCRSDWHAWKGHGEWADDKAPLGQVLGHEPAGRVLETGPGAELDAGERVVVPFNLGDGSCRYCTNGRGNVCPGGKALGFERDAPGAFAEYVRVPAADFNAARLPDSISFRDAAALGCRFATAYHALAHRGDVRTGDRVAVFGCGGLGLSAVQIATALGAEVVAVDIREAALDRAQEMGATTVNAAVSDTVTAVRESAGASALGEYGGAAGASAPGEYDGADITLDALGSSETCRPAIESLRPTGTHVQAGLTGAADRGEIALPVDRMAGTELDFAGARGMPPSRYDELLTLVADGRVDPGALVTRELALEDVSDRLAAMDDYETEGVEVVTEF